MPKAINPYFTILRPSILTMTILGIIIGSIVAGVLITHAILVVLAIIAAVLITGAGNALNDYYDLEADKINAPHRILPSGKIQASKIPPYAIALYLIGIIISFFISIWFLALAIFNTLVSAGYAEKLKKMPFIGNVSVSWLNASTLFAPSLFLGPFIGTEVLLEF